jgi:hypothetical protein
MHPKLKIIEAYNDRRYPWTFDNRQFFDLMAQPYEFFSWDQAHVYDQFDLAIIGTYDRHKLSADNRSAVEKIINKSTKEIILDIWHNWEYQLDGIADALDRNPNLFFVTNARDPYVQHPQLIFVDWLFNRGKAYYEQWPWRPGVRPWYWHSHLAYFTEQLTTGENKNKIFVAPNKTYLRSGEKRLVGDNHPRKYRRKLVDFLLGFTKQGYLGNYDDRPELFMYPHLEWPWGISREELETATRKLSYDSWGFLPPHIEYYKNTFISIYGETIEYGSTIAVTEKTYDPLTKGHFILPFSAQGFVRYLRELGILFPSFIDYSYDDIANDDLRYRAYEHEVDRLLNLPISTWRNHWNDNLDLLYQNQQIMHTRPYDRVNFKDLLI